MKILVTLVLFLVGCAANYDVYKPLASLPTTYNQDEISRYLLTQYALLNIEQVKFLYYKSGRILEEVKVNGGESRVDINLIEMVVKCSQLGCDKVIMAHNHPNQYWARPSPSDLDSADKLQDMSKQIGVVPHFIITGDADVNWLY